MKVHVRKIPQKLLHDPRARSLGCHVQGYANPIACSNDPTTIIHGAAARFCSDPPAIKPSHLRTLRSFVRMYIRKHFTPIQSGEDVSVASWLKKTHYSLSRQAELLKLWESRPQPIKLSKRDLANKSFIKNESYPEYKAARCINSRTDIFKCYSGPFFKIIEDEVFKQPDFAKHIPVDQRLAAIKEKLHRPGVQYFGTDFTAFESHFTKQVYDLIEMQLYKYMLKNFPEVFNNIRLALTRTQLCKFKNVDIKIPAKRMSGEMCTSLGNGFTNMIVCKYLCFIHKSECVGYFEGDDGIFVTTNFYSPSPADFAEIGWNIKINKTASFSEMDFCGMLADENDVQQIKDPLRVILNFGWTHSLSMHSSPKYLRGLLKAKAFSLLYELPSCPVLSYLAQHVLDETKHDEMHFESTSKHVSYWEWKWKQNIDFNRKIHVVHPTLATRLLFQKMFDVNLKEQEELEKYFSTFDITKPMCNQTLNNIISKCPTAPYLADYYNRYVVEIKENIPFNQIV